MRRALEERFATPSCKHAVFEDARIEGAGGAILKAARGVCALKRETPELRLRVLAAHRDCGLAANDDGCPFALREAWGQCAFCEAP
ncbi:MAG: hypothetical protein ACYDCL_01085 [Myxococcales bacterium]